MKSSGNNYAAGIKGPLALAGQFGYAFRSLSLNELFFMTSADLV